MLSVSSRVTQFGIEPAFAMAACTVQANCGSASWLAERLIDTRGTRPGESAAHRATSVQAVRRTHVPISLINPVSSARGNKDRGSDPSVGRMVPSDEGLRPDELTGEQVDDRLIVQHELSLIDGSTQVRFRARTGS